MKNHPGMDPYSIIGVAKGSTKAEIRKAYLARARLLHPDHIDRHQRPEDWKTANEMMSELNEAYAILCNEPISAEPTKPKRPYSRPSTQPRPDPQPEPTQEKMHNEGRFKPILFLILISPFSVFVTYLVVGAISLGGDGLNSRDIMGLIILNATGALFYGSLVLNYLEEYKSILPNSKLKLFVYSTAFIVCIAASTAIYLGFEAHR